MLETLETILRRAEGIEGKTKQIDGRTYVYDAKGLQIVEAPRLLAPKPLELSTLTGLVAWHEAEATGVMDGVDEASVTPEDLLIHVESPTRVSVIGPRRGPHHQRFAYAVATATDRVDDFLGKFHAQDDFVVALLTRFLAADDDRGSVLAYAGNLSEEAVKTSVDDGVSQVVTARKGIGTLATVKLPNVVQLTPRRTFPEIGGVPESLVLRVQTGPKVALFSADAGAWRMEATARVAEWLREKLPSAQVIA